MHYSKSCPLGHTLSPDLKGATLLWNPKPAYQKGFFHNTIGWIVTTIHRHYLTLFKNIFFREGFILGQFVFVSVHTFCIKTKTYTWVLFMFLTQCPN